MNKDTWLFLCQTHDIVITTICKFSDEYTILCVVYVLSIWSITQYPEIAWPNETQINIKIVGNTKGYPVELNRHNTLTFSQRAAPG